MATLIVLPSKRKQDIQKYAFYVKNLLLPGDAVDTGTISIAVFSGTDPFPEQLLLGPLTIQSGVFYQVIQEGIPGVIYEILLTVFTTQGRTLTVEARLAILPENLPAIPNYIPESFTSRPYPVYLIDALSLTFLPLGGELRNIVETTSTSDTFSLSFLPIGGSLRFPLKEIFPEDSFELSFLPLGGTLRDILIITETEDVFALTFTPLSGKLKHVLIQHTQAEAFSLSFTPLGGNLYVP